MNYDCFFAKIFTDCCPRVKYCGQNRRLRTRNSKELSSFNDSSGSLNDGSGLFNRGSGSFNGGSCLVYNGSGWRQLTNT